MSLQLKKGGRIRETVTRTTGLIVMALVLFWVPAPAKALTFNEEQKLLASDGAADDYFGRSVAVDGDTAVIGAYMDDDNGTNFGSAYVFTRNGGTWTQQVKLTASDGAAEDYFGYSVAVNGDTAVIGAAYDDDNITNSGSAYVFTKLSVTSEGIFFPVKTQNGRITIIYIE